MLTPLLTGGFGFVLSLSVTIPIITPVIGVGCPPGFEKDCFDMLKTIGFANLVTRL